MMPPVPPPDNPAAHRVRSDHVTESDASDYPEVRKADDHSFIVTTGNEIAGRHIRRYLGVVRGIVVRSPSISQGFFGGLQQIVGGNIEVYAEVCETARRDAYDRMVEHAQDLGADAIIAMRYDATEFSQSVTEVLAYGTAVRLAKE